jgi:hypothetical protein
MDISYGIHDNDDDATMVNIIMEFVVVLVHAISLSHEVNVVNDAIG